MDRVVVGRFSYGEDLVVVDSTPQNRKRRRRFAAERDVIADGMRHDPARNVVTASMRGGGRGGGGFDGRRSSWWSCEGNAYQQAERNEEHGSWSRHHRNRRKLWLTRILISDF